MSIDTFSLEASVPWISTIFGQIRAISTLIQPYVKMPLKGVKAINSTQLFSIVTTTLDVSRLFNQNNASAQAASDRWDKGLTIAGKLSEITEGVSNIGFGMADMGIVAANVVAWAPYVMLVAAAVSAVFLVIHGRAISKNVQLLKKDVLTQGDYDELKQCVRMDSRLMECIEKKPVAHSSLLKGRIKSEILSRTLGMLITTVFIAASVIFFIASALNSWGVVGVAVLAIGYTLNLAKMGYDIRVDYVFNREIMAS
jgi:hypothetical protein